MRALLSLTAVLLLLAGCGDNTDAENAAQAAEQSGAMLDVSVAHEQLLAEQHRLTTEGGATGELYQRARAYKDAVNDAAERGAMGEEEASAVLGDTADDLRPACPDCATLLEQAAGR